MNKKVLIVMIGLVLSSLISFYIIKWFLPQEFIMLIENEQIIKIGNYIDNTDWLCRVCDILLTFITYWLYINAVTEKWTLTWKEFLLVCLAIACNHVAYDFDINLAVAISVIAMLGIPAISNAKLRVVTIVYGVHYLSQTLSISIRNLPTLLTNVNYATVLLMTLECYFWLLLFYLVYNYRKEENYGKNLSATLW